MMVLRRWPGTGDAHDLTRMVHAIDAWLLVRLWLSSRPSADGLTSKARLQMVNYQFISTRRLKVGQRL